ncbi:MAG: hypothetical protein LLF86_05995 [Nitrospiraceae bacterium]|nr:hypothetical protein [Nitrospiraceae bacterium]
MPESPDINSLKKHNFYQMLDMAGRVFIMVRHSPAVIIGKRGFTEQEKERGLVLVFNPAMKFVWDDLGIEATLAFGSSAQKCSIPADDIIAVYSPDMNMQFIAPGIAPEPAADSAERKTASLTPADTKAKVVKVDFAKKEKK